MVTSHQRIIFVREKGYYDFILVFYVSIKYEYYSSVIVRRGVLFGFALMEKKKTKYIHSMIHTRNITHFRFTGHILFTITEQLGKK